MQLYGFDWSLYRDRIMPAFARWLLENDARAVQALYEGTRLAYEEAFVPAVMEGARTWPRALAFVESLPRGPHSLHEYRLLCSAEEFTALSDRYLYRHIPHLCRPSEALATLWSALVETYCLRTEQEEPEADTACVGETYFEIGVTFQESRQLAGITLGRHPNVLRLRGWLASISPRALALFEYLACGRRGLPFHHAAAGEPHAMPGSHYSGYLTPTEVSSLAICLEKARPPSAAEAAHDDRLFRRRRAAGLEERLIDEVLPLHAEDFLRTVRRSAARQLGLICAREPAS
jgi:hypothetical protein